MNAIQFESKNKSAEISIAELAQTMELGNSTGEMPKNIPMQPGVLLESILEKVHRLSGLEAIAKPIVVREQYCQVDRRKLNAGQELDFGDYIVKRFVTKIELPIVEFDNTSDRLSPTIALTYAYTDNAKGIQIAFGENVSVCENLTAFGKYHFSTFGGTRIAFDEGMQLLDHWLQNLMPIHTAHLDTITQLKQRYIGKNHFIELIGNLFQSSVRKNTGANIFAPLNQSQVASMVAAADSYLKEIDFSINGWDIMNLGTAVLKPHNSDMLQLLEDTTGFNDFILREMNIPFIVPEFVKP